MDEFEKEEALAEKKGGFEDAMMGDMAASMKKDKKPAPALEEEMFGEDMDMGMGEDSEVVSALQLELGLSPEDAKRAIEIMHEKMGM